ncbi:MAG TPA: YdcF family protein [Mycobacterium sp.]
MTSRRIRWAAASAACTLFGWAEWVTWRASRDFLPSNPPQATGADTVLVLGCPWPVLQRWRVRIAVRSTDPQQSRFVFSGAAVRTPVSEAQMMADYAVHTLGVPAANVVVEDRSRTTVQNVVNTIPLMPDGSAVKVASNTFHARRARRILFDESPELGARLVRARDYLPLEWGPLHVLLVAFEYYRDRRPSRGG